MSETPNNTEINLQNELNEAKESVDQAIDLLNKIEGNKDYASEMLTLLESSENKEEIKGFIKDAMQKKIEKIRGNKNTTREEIATPQNAIILQTYDVLFNGSTTTKIDGKFGSVTLGILKYCQRNGIGGKKNLYVEEIGSNLDKKQKERIEIEKLKGSIPRRIEGEKNDENSNEVSYVGGQINIKKVITKSEIDGEELLSYNIDGDKDFVNWAEEFDFSELFEGIPVKKGKIEKIYDENYLYFEFNDKGFNEDYNKRYVKIPDSVRKLPTKECNKALQKLIEGEIKKSVEEKRIFNAIDKNIESDDLIIPQGLEKIQKKEGLIQLENLNFTTDFYRNAGESGKQVRYIEFDFDSAGVFDKVDGNSTYRVKISDLEGLSSPVEIINKILDIKNLEIKQNIEKNQ